MNLYLRLLLTLVRARFERSLSTRVACCQWFRVWPNDIDAFCHMNNGRYLQIMDIARARWLLRTGTLGVIRRRRWSVALGGNLIRYRRPLRLWTSYRVSTRLVCWDDRWFSLEHQFHHTAGRMLAAGFSRAAFRGAGDWVTTDIVMDEVDTGVESPPIPGYVEAWLEVEDAMCESLGDLPSTRSLPQGLRWRIVQHRARSTLR